MVELEVRIGERSSVMTHYCSTQNASCVPRFYQVTSGRRLYIRAVIYAVNHLSLEICLLVTLYIQGVRDRRPIAPSSFVFLSWVSFASFFSRSRVH